MSRILVTGGSGFIGSHVTRLLVAAGHDVTVLASPRGSLWRLHDVADRVRVLCGDLAMIEAARPDVERLAPEICIHLAWYAEPGKYLTSAANVPCMHGSLRPLEVLLAARCRRLVMAGTCAEYDADYGYFREDQTPTKPATLYAAAKLSTGLVARHLADAAGAKLAWARLFLLYGPYEDERRMVPALIRTFLAGQPFPASRGDQVRDYLHVRDMAAALCVLAEKEAEGVYNVCSADPVTVRTLMETAGELIRRADLIRFGAVPARVWEPPVLAGDNGKLRGLGWSPEVRLKAGLAEAVAWWQGRTPGYDARAGRGPL